MELYIIVGLIVSAFGITLAVIFKKPQSKIEKLVKNEAELIPNRESSSQTTTIAQTKKDEISFKERLQLGLKQSRGEVWGKMTSFFIGGKLNSDAIDSIEELLYGADIGTKTVDELMTLIKSKVKDGTLDENNFKTFLFQFLKDKIDTIQSGRDQSLFTFKESEYTETKVIMVVGVNGAGKTTTIGKLATKLREQGASVVVGACDTFRAAAVDQLQVWCDRAGAQMIRAKEGASPSGVGYEALQFAMNQKAHYCILDTAGRLHTKENLMEELQKSKNVLKKLNPNAPHHTLLVIDAITGQNALRQAEEFNKSLSLTGLIFTKCDGSSKAGSAISIIQELALPINYIGVGETAQDLDVFNTDDYLNALLGI